MTRKDQDKAMSEGNNRDWRSFQDEVAGLFNRISGCVAHVDQPIQGSRIGTVHVDVLAEFGAPTEKSFQRHHRFVFTVIVECKFWKRPIPQEKVFALKTIVEDVGAAMGIIVSEVRMQRGATKYLDHSVNVRAMTFTELEAYVSGMHVGICVHCGEQALIPFRASPGKSFYCTECYRKLHRI